MKPHLLVVLAATTLLGGCHEKCQELPQPQEEADGPCVDLALTPGGIYRYVYKLPFRSSPVYNPRDPQEIGFLVDTFETVAPGLGGVRCYLQVRDLRSGRERTLMSNLTSSQQPDWHRSGWLLASCEDGRIWKVKSNGDSLTQLPGQGFDSAPAWSPDGRQYACYRLGSTPATTGVVLCRADGTLIRMLARTLGTVSAPLAWSPDGRRLAGVSHMGGRGVLAAYELSTDQLTELAPLPYPELLFSVRWLPNGQDLVWAATQGVSMTNEATRQTRQLRGNCPNDTRFFSSVAPSPDGQRLLYGRLAVSLDGGYKIGTGSLETTNLAGKDIRKISF